MRIRNWIWAGLLAALMTLGLASQAQADPAVSTSLSAAATMRWDGAATSSQLGALSTVNAGDISGDGRNDLLASSNNPSPYRGAYVLFTPKNGAGSTDTGMNLKPQQGYLIHGTIGGLTLANVGDQNGDGVPDIMTTANDMIYVLFGVRDPSTLPVCGASPNITRCLNVNTITPSQGYRIDTSNLDDAFGSSYSNLGDLNGDSIDDFSIGAPMATYNGTGSGSVWVVHGGLTPPVDSNPIIVDSLPTTQAVRVDGALPGDGLAAAFGIGDIVGGAENDVAFSMIGTGVDPATTYIMDGQALDASPIDLADFGPEDGFRLRAGVLTPSLPANAGDVNGDGRDDLVVGMDGTLDADGGASIVYSPESPYPATPINARTVSGTAGYAFSVPAGSGGHLGKSFTGIGDLNGDGIPDQMIGAYLETVGGNVGAGTANIVFGQRPSPLGPVPLGPDMSPDDAMALAAPMAAAWGGHSVQSAGDIDSDGLTDFFISAPRVKEVPLNNSGSVYLVPGSAVIGQATTGLAGVVTDNGATLGGTGAANGRESDAYFEWGTDTEYGETSSVEAIGTSHGAKFFEANLEGLTPETTYHYRAVVENDLGVKAYGPDRTFTTTKIPQTPCQADPNAPGCRQPCEVNPDAPGCKPNPPTAAKLSTLVASPKSVKVKRGKKTSLTVVVSNTGGTAAEGAKVCLSAPSKLVKGAKCRTIGSLAAGGTAATSFTVTVKKKAKKGKKATLKFTASANGVDARTASSKLTVR